MVVGITCDTWSSDDTNDDIGVNVISVECLVVLFTNEIWTDKQNGMIGFYL